MTHQAARELLTDALAVRTLLSAPASWCQFRDYRIEPLPDQTVRLRYCIQGAVMMVTRPVTSRSPRYMALCRLLASVIGPTEHLSLVHWNDDRARTHGEILNLLDRAVAEAFRRLPAPAVDRAQRVGLEMT